MRMRTFHNPVYVVLHNYQYKLKENFATHVLWFVLETIIYIKYKLNYET